MRTTVVAAALLVACGAPATPAEPSAARDAGAPGSADAGVSAGAGLPALDALAARGAVDAPLMRELARFDQAAPRSPEVHAERDLCVRVVFAASGPALVSLVDSAGLSRGDAVAWSRAMPDALVPARGPACITKGETLHVVVDAARSVVVRAVVFGAP